MIALSQEISPSLRFYQLTIEVNWIFNRFVLDWQNFDLLDDLIQEKFAKNIVSYTTGTFLA